MISSLLSLQFVLQKTTSMSVLSAAKRTNIHHQSEEQASTYLRKVVYKPKVLST